MKSNKWASCIWSYLLNYVIDSQEQTLVDKLNYTYCWKFTLATKITLPEIPPRNSITRFNKQRVFKWDPTRCDVAFQLFNYFQVSQSLKAGIDICFLPLGLHVSYFHGSVCSCSMLTMKSQSFQPSVLALLWPGIHLQKVFPLFLRGP